MKEQGAQFEKVQGISGAGMQHGTVFWSRDAESKLASLDGAKTLVEQLKEAFSHPHSPNWQDASTQKQCEGFDRALGSEAKLADATGSSAHHVSGQCGEDGSVLTNGVAIQWTADSTIPREVP